MDSAAMLVTRLLQTFPVERVILLGREGDAAIVATLDDVLWLTGQDVAGQAGHERSVVVILVATIPGQFVSIESDPIARFVFYFRCFSFH